MLAPVNYRLYGGEALGKIVLIDGTYGVGKTTVAQSICDISNGEYIFIDPDEYFNNNLGRFILYGWPTCNNMAILGEIQKAAEERIQESNIVVPLTLNSSKYKNIWIQSFEDFAKVYHFILMAKKEQILKRIGNDEKRNKTLAIEMLDSNLKYYQGDIEGSIKIDTSNIDPQMVAKLIIELIQ